MELTKENLHEMCQEVVCESQDLDNEKKIKQILDDAKFREYWTFEILDGISLDKFKAMKERAERCLAIEAMNQDLNNKNKELKETLDKVISLIQNLQYDEEGIVDELKSILEKK